MTTKSALRYFVIPSLKITGGNLEIIRLARELAAREEKVALVAMWRASHEADTHDLRIICLSQSIISPLTVLAQLPMVVWRFHRLLKSGLRTAVFSHYVTFALAWMVSRKQRWFFVQDTEWLFVSGARKQALLRQFILAALGRGKVISANRYLTGQFEKHGIGVAAEAPIWADPAFLGTPNGHREIDLVAILRRGAHKRADLTLSVIEAVSDRLPGVRIVIIAPDPTYRQAIPQSVTYIERPTLPEMRSIYENTLVFALMSEHEGFGLPPLEAMGSGCVPVCRDAGGVTSYMIGELEANILPLEIDAEEIAGFVVGLLEDRARLDKLSAAARAIFAEGQITTSQRLPCLLEAGL